MEEGVPPDTQLERNGAVDPSDPLELGGGPDPEPEPEVVDEVAPELGAAQGVVALHWLSHAEQKDGPSWHRPPAPWECRSELQPRLLRLLLAYLLHDRLAEDCAVFLEGGRIPELIAACFRERPPVSSAPDQWPGCGVRAGAWAMRYMTGSDGVYLVNSSAPTDQDQAPGVLEIVAASNGWFRSAKNLQSASRAGELGLSDSPVAFDVAAADMWWSGGGREPESSQGTQSFSVGVGESRSKAAQAALAASLAELWHSSHTNPRLAPGTYSLGARSQWTVEVEPSEEIVIRNHPGERTKLRLRVDGVAKFDSATGVRLW